MSCKVVAMARPSVYTTDEAGVMVRREETKDKQEQAWNQRLGTALAGDQGRKGI